MKLRLLILSLTLLLIPSCGNGGGSSSSSQVAVSGGIGGTGISRGTITAFGSIFVNGVEWDIDTATITLDGLPATEDDLALGMVVSVEGEVEGETGSATNVDFEDEIEGPIEVVGPVIPGSPRTRTISILGVIIVLEEGTTIFDNALAGDFNFDNLSAGQVVEVSGFRVSQSQIIATRVERKSDVILGSTEIELKGVISDYDGDNKFRIGTSEITFDPDGITTDLSDLNNGIEDGLFVEVKGILETATSIRATQIEEEDEDFDEETELSLEGIITSFTDLSNFHIGSVQIDASEAELQPNDPTLFKEGVRVEVEGTIENGILKAKELQVRAGESHVSGEVEASGIDLENQSMILVDISIQINSTTVFEDDLSEEKGSSSTGGFKFEDIKAGDFIEADGLEVDGILIATKIKRAEPEKIKLKGRVQEFDLNAQTLTILGLTIPTNSETEFEDRFGNKFPTSDAFFNTISEGTILEIEDEDEDLTSIDFADEVEIED